MESLEDHEDPLEVLGLYPDPVVGDHQVPHLPVPERGDPDLGPGVRPAELEGVRDQVLEDLDDLVAVPQDRRKPPVTDLGPVLRDGAPEVGLRVANHPVEGEGGEGSRPRGDPRESAQAVDQPLHPRPPLDDEPDHLVRVFVKAPPVTALEELHEADDAPERFLEIMARHVREPLEVLVRPRELPRGLSLFRDVMGDQEHLVAPAVVSREGQAGHEQDPLAAVGPRPPDLPPDRVQGPDRLVQEPVPGGPAAGAGDLIVGTADQLPGGPPRERGPRLVHEQVAAVAIDDGEHHRHGRGGEPEPGLACTHRLLCRSPGRDVDERGGGGVRLAALV